MKLGSLFDGSGGFPFAAQQSGIEPVWASEIEPLPIAVTCKRFPNMKHLGDVSRINGDYVVESTRCRKERGMMSQRQYVKIYCCSECANYKRHKCALGATDEGGAHDHFYRDCPHGVKNEEPSAGWTSVKDQLPENDGEYLVWIQYDFAEFPQYDIVPFDNCAGAFGEFVERFDKGALGYIGEEFHEQKGVLAWMPLPEHPERSENNES